MPHRKGRKHGKGGVDSATIPFHYCLANSFVAGVFGFNLQPTNIPRLLLEADVWCHFRIRKFSFRLLPTSPVTVAQGAGYVGGVEDTPPATYIQIAELIPSCLKGVGQTVPTNWVHVPRSDLAGPFPWYKAIPGSADATEESPGVVVVVGTGTETFNLEMKGVFEFKTAVNAANTPAALNARRIIREERLRVMRAKERDSLMRVLSTPTHDMKSP